MPHRHEQYYVVLHELQCRVCHIQFFICPGCYRGQRYCGPRCRTRARRQQLRAANARHQQSEPGRLDHNDRQRAYRHRLRTRSAAAPVTDQTSPEVNSESSSSDDAVAPLPPARSRRRRRAEPTLRCSRCGRPGFPFTWAALLLGLCRLFGRRLRASHTPP